MSEAGGQVRTKKTYDEARADAGSLERGVEALAANIVPVSARPQRYRQRSSRGVPHGSKGYLHVNGAFLLQHL